ncbi:MAG: hypothetical protein ACO3K7_02025 [Candidatus Marinamargulisbacteria bacterium]
MKILNTIGGLWMMQFWMSTTSSHLSELNPVTNRSHLPMNDSLEYNYLHNMVFPEPTEDITLPNKTMKWQPFQHILNVNSTNMMDIINQCINTPATIMAIDQLTGQRLITHINRYLSHPLHIVSVGQPISKNALNTHDVSFDYIDILNHPGVKKAANLNQITLDFQNKIIDHYQQFQITAKHSEHIHSMTYHLIQTIQREWEYLHHVFKEYIESIINTYRLNDSLRIHMNQVFNQILNQMNHINHLGQMYKKTDSFYKVAGLFIKQLFDDQLPQKLLKKFHEKIISEITAPIIYKIQSNNRNTPLLVIFNRDHHYLNDLPFILSAKSFDDNMPTQTHFYTETTPSSSLTMGANPHHSFFIF